MYVSASETNATPAFANNFRKWYKRILYVNHCRAVDEVTVGQQGRSFKVLLDSLLQTYVTLITTCETKPHSQSFTLMLTSRSERIFPASTQQPEGTLKILNLANYSDDKRN